MKKSFVVLFVMILPSCVWGESDSLRYRLLESYLKDSTLIRYELGGIGIVSGGETRYLPFANKDPKTVSAWYTTTPFRIAASTDSIVFLRFASYDDKNDPGNVTVDTDPSSDSRRLFDVRMEAPYQDTFFYVAPDSAVFNSRSRIRYIMEVDDSATGKRVTDLDTLLCFRGLFLTNRMVYATSSKYDVSASLSLKHLPRNHALYITVRRETSLPVGSAIVRDKWAFESTNYPGPTGRNVHMIDQVGYPRK